MLDKKQIRAIFLSSKCKAAEIAHNINDAFDPRTANECTVQWWIKKFCKGDKSLEGEECSDWSSEVDNDQLRGSLKVILHKKLPKNSTLTILWSFSIWSKLKRWKNSISGCLMSWQQIKKSSFLSVVFSFLCNENKAFLDPTVMCNKKWILYDNWQQSAQWWTKKKPPGKPQETPKHFPKPNSDQKKVMVTVCWSAKGIIHDSFLNPGKTITSEKYAQQIHETHQKLLSLKPASVKRKGPIFLHNTRPHSAQPTLQKLNKLGYKILPHPPYSPDHSSTDDHFFRHLNKFLKDKCFHNQQEGENAFQEFVISQSIDFYVTRINKLISHWKNVLIAIVPILINKDVFEPSYNDLRFTVWNRNYFFTNLIIKNSYFLLIATIS